jgi:ATP-dependent DNA helicase DinG
MSSASVLGPGGLIAQHLPGYESRRQQVEMAEAVERAIAGKHHLMVEAGTGVGKSFAYLVPAMLAVSGNKDFRVVVSTHTISLQEQLIRKDIPFLQKVMGKDVRPVLVKGRSNYLSLRRLRAAQVRSSSLFADPALERQLVQIGKWSRQTFEGSKSDLGFQPAPSVWDLVESDSGNCLGRGCAEYARCFYFKARKQMHGANLLIVNHALFFSDLALRREGAAMLPDYQVVVFDEAHTLEDVASEKMGIHVGQGAVEYLLNKLYNRQKKGLFSWFGEEDAIRQLLATRTASERFFHALHGHVQGKSPSRRAGGEDAFSSATVRVNAPGVVPDVFSEELKKLAGFVESIGEKLDDEQKIEFLAVANRIRQVQQGICSWLEQKLSDQVYWIERSTSSRGERLDLVSAPIEVGPLLREYLYTKVPTVILTSATLSVSQDGRQNGFRHFQERLGLERCPTAQLGSPFNYREQAELHLFQRTMPDPAGDPPRYEEAVLAILPEYIKRTDGRAFVLFTSNQMMRKAADRLRPWCQKQGLNLLSQSDGLGRSQMLESFREGKAVLFGVDSFWQGVDVPGDALTNVIITKLPFAAPDVPILAARQEAIEAGGGKPFFEFQVPRAVIKLKQGFGRLIRTAQDRGMVVILDPRVLTKGYGRTFLEALPECRRFVDGVAVSG